jgi:hypothetical protein
MYILQLLSTAYNKLSMTVKEQSKDLIDFKSQEAVQGWEAPPKATVSKEETQNLSQGKRASTTRRKVMYLK